MMEQKGSIIAIRKRDIALAHEAFVQLMGNTERIINSAASANPAAFRSLTPTALEKEAVDVVRKACASSPFDAREVCLISGQHFPDIVAEKYYGVEVKSTKDNHWTSTGSSIMESTRVESVEDIFMLFGKLGGALPQFRCRPYQEVLYDIAVTHSPRYLIDMELEEGETIFSKMGIAYDEFRTSSDVMKKVRHYYAERARRQKRHEMPWWITEENVEKPHSFNIKMWHTLEPDEKRSLMTKCMILFPEALNPACSRTKYDNTTLWLCSYHQVVNPNIRDMYSAGGQITHVNGERLEKPAAKVFSVVVRYADRVRAELESPTQEMLQLIDEFNPKISRSGDRYEEWLSICCGFAAENEVPLRKWIEEKPQFTFSGR